MFIKFVNLFRFGVLKNISSFDIEIHLLLTQSINSDLKLICSIHIIIVFFQSSLSFKSFKVLISWVFYVPIEISIIRNVNLFSCLLPKAFLILSFNRWTMIPLMFGRFRWDFSTLIHRWDRTFITFLQRTIISQNNLGIVSHSLRSTSSHRSLVCIELEHRFWIGVFSL